VVLGVAGGATAWIGGYLGGHLSLARKVGTADPHLAGRGRPAARLLALRWPAVTAARRRHGRRSTPPRPPWWR
jgi:hypothetical protein